MIRSEASLCAHLAPLPEHQLAIHFEGQALNYGQLRDAIVCAARVLGDLGVRRGDRVAMLTLNEPEVLVNLFALNALGAALLPMNSRLAPAEWRACLDDAGCDLVIVDEQALAGFSFPGKTIFLADWRQMNGARAADVIATAPSARHAAFRSRHA